MTLVGPFPAAGAGPLLPEVESEPSHPIAFERYTVTVEGELATGWLAYPTDLVPQRLLVIAHGCCVVNGAWSGEDAVLNGSYHMAAWAAAGAAVVAMDFRGPGQWDVWNGHLDTIAATEDLQARWPIDRTVLWGRSMGGEVAGMAVAARADLYDFWVSQYGVSNLIEEFAFLGLAGAQPDSPRSWILEEAGLPPQAHEEWRVRSPALRAAEMSGLTRAYFIHGVGDPIVPASQSVEMAEALRHAGVATTLVLMTSNQDACADCGIQAPFDNPWTGEAPAGPAAHGRWTDGPTFYFLTELLAGRTPHDQYDALVGVVDYSADNVVRGVLRTPFQSHDHVEVFAQLPLG